MHLPTAMTFRFYDTLVSVQKVRRVIAATVPRRVVKARRASQVKLRITQPNPARQLLITRANRPRPLTMVRTLTHPANQAKPHTMSI